MKLIRYFLVGLSLCIPLLAAERADITLSSGQVLKGARIVSISSKEVSIMHSGGLIGVAPEDVPLDVLARAHMDLEAKKEEREKQTADIAARATAQAQAKASAKNEEIQLRLAEAAARERALASVPPPAGADIAKRLAALKQRFPERRSEVVTTQSGKINIDIPAVDVWSFYRSTVQTTTLEALPRSLAQIDARLARDTDTLNKRAKELKDFRSQASELAQAQKTLAWFRDVLRPYVAELKALR